VSRTLAKRRVRVTAEDATALIRAAAQMCPQWRPLGIPLAAFDDGRRYHVDLQFGADEHGTSTTVYVDIDERAARVTAAYLHAQFNVRACMLSVDVANVTDAANDDGGEELAVPTISQAVASRLSSVQ